MTDDELTELIGPDVDVLCVMALGPDGIARRLDMDRHTLRSPQATMALLRRVYGHLTTIPRLTDDEHAELIRSLVGDDE